jgi:Fe-S-cluster containining protein
MKINMPLSDYLKRVWLWQTKRKAILKSLKERKGECKKCGKCCRLFGLRCIFLDKNNQCRIYRFRPFLLCRIPPLNIFKGEIKKHRELNCGYYWEKTGAGSKKA